MARLKDTYKSEIAPALMSKFGYKSVMQIPKLEKIVINCGCSELRENPKVLDSIMGDLMKITGQRPVATKARKSVANFKLREGMVIGAKVTLRGDQMYEFTDRLSMWRCPVSGTSAALTPTVLTARATSTWASRSSSSSRRSTTTRSTRSGV